MCRFAKLRFKVAGVFKSQFTGRTARQCLSAFPMSSGGGSSSRCDQVRGVARYDQVGAQRDDDPLPPRRQQQGSSRLALSPDPLPPPPLPEHSPVGPEFDPSGSEDSLGAIDLKPVHRFIPDSWKNFFRGSRGSRKEWFPPPPDNNNSSSEGVRCSPPQSPSVPGSYRDPYGGSGGSYNSHKERKAKLLGGQRGPADERAQSMALTHAERMAAYRQRHGNMRSWAGLLRVLGCAELLLGAAVFACVCAYIHKDNEWYNMFGYSQSQMYGYMGPGMAGGGAGVYYTGPKTPFVLVVAGLAWLVTVILLVLGMTMYYRTILLDSGWWPITEFIINLVLAVLYMAAGIVYVRDTTRGGLCYYPMFNNGMSGNFCQTEPGQTAAIFFLFIIMILYLIGAILCLKVWRHEMARKHREVLGQEPVSTVAGLRAPELVQAAPVAMQPEVLRGHIPPPGYKPKPLIMPDYVAKYPSIRTREEWDQYRAVFKDQYAEYKELHAEVQAAMRKFDEMDGLMRSLPQHPSSQMERDRINRILQEYQRKKNDPAFLEKKERCEYLKSKLSHIKQKIQEYNKVADWKEGFS
ncbi:hypothetical protein MATL_G00087940 [Megalops atlanticus]|uniref:MARVEL domain-containing protein 2 n=1 Tax=Megalops atlanticus TaxID=7932 RepID=A0A9D3Q336_MEGAT|nr:hypothetical protein MATL_G00087940 [Megalops atlanticus]